MNMNYDSVTLANERSTHLTKRLNRLSTWKFFLVLYRNSTLRMFLVQLLMLLFCAPIIVFIVLGNIESVNLLGNLPYNGSFTTSSGVWTDVAGYYASNMAAINHSVAWKAALGGILTCFMFSGGFAIIRDSFWTGKITVFRCFAQGVKANFLYALCSSILISAMIYGAFEFYWFAASALPLWLAIVLTVLVCIVAALATIYLLLLCSVSVTYKQSLRQNLSDTWKLMWGNILSAIFRLIITAIPFVLYAVVGGFLQTLVLVMLILIGFFYIPFVWQTWAMMLFAHKHPVLVNKKGETKVTAAPAEQTKA